MKTYIGYSSVGAAAALALGLAGSAQAAINTQPFSPEDFEQICLTRQLTEQDVAKLRASPVLPQILDYTLDHCPELAALISDVSVGAIGDEGQSHAEGGENGRPIGGKPGGKPGGNGGGSSGGTGGGTDNGGNGGGTGGGTDNGGNGGGTDNGGSDDGSDDDGSDDNGSDDDSDDDGSDDGSEACDD
ncbi:MAG: hypothetical protein H6895_06565 [Defluviimonas sp.]|uniref:hypothetical protein n=1 Tax=Albidovulum sp. TaxID=1872424 RepID=UPI001DACA968|nr:hypothetical protein [Paracoccaceae bacterium]MCC0063734.1 hypothetical protein [Defluviimonas sp.]